MAIRRAAIERVAKLGDLYDARSDKFLNKSLLTIDPNDNIIKSHVLDEDNQVSIIHFADNFTDRAESLDIELDLQASIASGLVNIKGAHTFLLDNENEMSSYLIYRINTKQEKLDLKVDNMNIDERNLEYVTHVTEAIDYGALCVVTCHYNAKDTKLEENEIKNKLETILNSFKDELENEIENQSDEIMDESFHFTVKCDLTQFHSQSKVCYKDAMNFIKTIMSGLKPPNADKGVPQVYHLKPLDHVKQEYNLEFNILHKYKPVDKNILKNCLIAYEEFQLIDKKFKKLKNEFPEINALCSSIGDDIKQGLRKITNTISEFKEKMQAILLMIRSGNRNNQGIDSLLKDFKEKVSELKLQLEKIQSDKINLLKSSQIRNQGFTIITNDNKQSPQNFQNGFVLYIQDLNLLTEQNENFKIFQHLSEIHLENQNFYIVPLEELNLTSIEEKKEGIHFYKEGTVCDNVVEVINFETASCFVELDSHPKTTVSRRKVIVKTMFDNKFFTDSVEHHPYWFCCKCRHNIEYGLDTKLLYCRCGESNPKNVKFLTNDLFLYSHDITKLSTVLDNLPQSREINVLVLGETGVGKSTWINGIYNYFRYDNLSEASQSEIVVPIPSKFQYNGKTISVGNYSENENTSIRGEVGTLGPKLYPMIYEDYKVNIIDTPGVGDTRGKEQDKENFNKSLDFLSDYDKLHAVCILLKTNSNRMTEWFTFCLDSLLTHLHSSIVKNIVFCFTHGRSTFYTPGDTLPVLQQYLKDKNINLEADPERNCFVFDNESFRYLACLQNGDESVRRCFDDFNKSWIVARDETLKLFHCVCHLEAHDLKTTISLHSARQALLTLEYPLATVVDTLIPANIEIAENYEKDFLQTQDNTSELEKQLKFKGKSLKTNELDHPITVCTNEKCTTEEKVGLRDSETESIYNVCHENCRIDGLQTNAVNDERIAKCDVFHCYKEENLKKVLGEEKAAKFIQESLQRYTYKCTDPVCKEKSDKDHSHDWLSWKTIDENVLIPVKKWWKGDKIIKTDDDDVVDHHHKRFLPKRMWGSVKKWWNFSSEERSKLKVEYREECFVCGHSYKDHMHLTYELELVDEEFIDPDVQEKILQMNTSAKRIKAILEEVNKNMQELRQEKEEIYSAQAKFFVFIERNSLVPMKDSFEDFIQTVINREKDSAKLTEIQTDFEEYKKLKQKLKEDNSGNLTSEEIMSILNSLKRLKHIGQSISHAAEKLDELKAKRHAERFVIEEEIDKGIDLTTSVPPPCATQSQISNAISKGFNFLLEKFKRKPQKEVENTGTLV